MLPRHILCVLFTLVLCCSYISLVSAASHESTGKFNNLMHGRNSSLSAQSLAVMSQQNKEKLLQKAEWVLSKLRGGADRARAEISESNSKKEEALKIVAAAKSLQKDINKLNIEDKAELNKLAEEFLKKANKAVEAAEEFQREAEGVLQSAEEYIREVEEEKNKVDTAQDWEYTDIDGTIDVREALNSGDLDDMNDKKEESSEAKRAAEEAQEVAMEAYYEAEDSLLESDNHDETQSTAHTDTKTSQENTVSTPAAPRHDEEETQKTEEEEQATKDAGSSSTPTNPTKTKSDGDASQVPVNNDATKQGKQESSKDPVPPVTTKKEEEKELGVETPLNNEGNTKNSSGTTNLNNNNTLSTNNHENNIDGTNTIGWVHLLLLAVTILSCVFIY